MLARSPAHFLFPFFFCQAAPGTAVPCTYLPSNHHHLFPALYFWVRPLFGRSPSSDCEDAVQVQTVPVSLLRPPTPQSGVFSIPVISPLAITYKQVPPFLLYDLLFNRRLALQDRFMTHCVCMAPATLISAHIHFLSQLCLLHRT